MSNTSHPLGIAFQNLSAELSRTQALHEVRVRVRGGARIAGPLGVAPAGASNHSEPLRILETAVNDAVKKESDMRAALHAAVGKLTTLIEAPYAAELDSVTSYKGEDPRSLAALSFNSAARSENVRIKFILANLLRPVTESLKKLAA